MKLVIDLGNTFQKLAVFSDTDMVYSESHDKITIEILAEVFKRFPIQSAVISSVIHHEKEIESFVGSKCRCLNIDHHTLLPFVNEYGSPETLGNDRLAAAVAGNHLFPNSDVLVIDAGTCIKYDFVTSHAAYLGGAISPGLQMRFQALHTFTGRLPLLTLSECKTLTGKTTEESLLSGVVNGAVAEIDGIIDQYRLIYPEIQIVLSGGDAEYLVGKLKNRIFAVANIVLNGLKIILDHNDKQKTL